MRSIAKPSAPSDLFLRGFERLKLPESQRPASTQPPSGRRRGFLLQSLQTTGSTQTSANNHGTWSPHLRRGSRAAQSLGVALLLGVRLFGRPLPTILGTTVSDPPNWKRCKWDYLSMTPPVLHLSLRLCMRRHLQVETCRALCSAS